MLPVAFRRALGHAGWPVAAVSTAALIASLVGRGAADPAWVEPGAPAAPPPEAPVPSSSGGRVAAPALDPAPRWLAIGGGSTPELNQLSLEHDLRLAAQVFGDGGRLLFGGGAGADGVQVLDEGRQLDPVLAELGALFQPRGGRSSRYRPTQLTGAGAATVLASLAALAEGLAAGEGPFLLFAATHGDAGQEPHESTLALWEDGALGVVDLARHLDRHQGDRRVRLVVTACYGGGFADVIFTGGLAAKGVTEHDRCGLFATTWDLQASGCDPHPDRRTHEGYGVHLLHALRGEDRRGVPLPRGQIDLDGDGAISLLEAHTHVRIVSPSIDVPTTTSERWLRHAVDAAAPPGGRPGPPPATIVEEDAVVLRLGERLAAPTEQAAEEAHEAVQAELARLHAAEDELAAAESALARRASAAVLARWPVLDDPYHPDFWPTYQRDRAAIERFLDAEAALSAYREAAERTAALGDELDALTPRAAALERLVRAHANRRLAAVLEARGGPAYERYRRLLACERSVP